MTAAAGEAAVRRRLPWLVALIALFVFGPFVFLRYEFHDSWAWLYWINGSRLIEGAHPCLALGGHYNLLGRPLMTPILCAMTGFGAEIGLVWIPKLFALLLLFASGALVLAVLRGVGASAAVGALALGSALFLPGFVLMVATMVANPVAWAAFAAVLAGFLWWRLALGGGHGLAAWGASLPPILVLLVAAFATERSVATLFFVPLLAAIVFSEARAGGRAMLKAAAGAALLFLAAAAVFHVAHRILLLDHGYFFMPAEQVRAAAAERALAAIGSLAELGEKLAFLGRLAPRVLSLWFVSEHDPVHPVMPWVFGAATLAFLALFARRTADFPRVLALLLVTACCFGPFAVSPNAGNGLYQLERFKVFMQVPFVLFLWALVSWLFARRSWLLPAAGGALAIAAAAGLAVSWLAVMRARVMPNYMELKHVEVRLRDAVRRDVRRIYIVKTEDGHLRSVIGVPYGDEFGRITSFYFPHQMVYALLLEMEKKATQRAVVEVDADKAHTIPAGGPEKLVLDMRKFP